jgi:hypothetical protein
MTLKGTEGGVEGYDGLHKHIYTLAMKVIDKRVKRIPL